jgi:hypothetical protein
MSAYARLMISPRHVCSWPQSDVPIDCNDNSVAPAGQLCLQPRNHADLDRIALSDTCTSTRQASARAAARPHSPYQARVRTRAIPHLACTSRRPIRCGTIESSLILTLKRRSLRAPGIQGCRSIRAVESKRGQTMQLADMLGLSGDRFVSDYVEAEDV